MSSNPIRVLIAEDSPTIRYYLTKIIGESQRLEVIGTADDGEQVLDMAAALEPDVISMDVQMPRMDGLTATRHLMRSQPTPVVIVSGLVEREIDLSFRALQAGALAVVPKPPARTDPAFEAHRRQLVNTLQAMADVRVIKRWASVYEVTQADDQQYQTKRIRKSPQIIAVAASAGGPSALATLLAGMRNRLTIPMVVVQHMPAEFIQGLTRWLARFTDIPIRLAEDRELLSPGVVYLAPGHAHLQIDGDRGQFSSRLITDTGSYRYQPAADVLFASVAAVAGERGVGIVLTGMGDDGALGLLAMRRSGARTFVQDEASCVVFGMPAAAIEAGAAERVMSPPQLAAALTKLL